MPNFTSFLDVNARYWPSKKVAVFPELGVEYTFPQMVAMVNKLGNALKDLGVRKGDRVVLYLPTAPETLIGYFSIWRIGAVAVPVNIVLKELEIKHILGDSEPKVVITNSAGYEVASRARVSSIEHIVLTDEKREGALYFYDVIKDKEPRLSPENCDFDTLCQIQYTSGTTGTPKGVMLTHGNWMVAVDAERWVLKLTDEDVMLYIYPLVHIGSSWAITALRYGATVVFMQRYKMDKYLRYAAEFRASILCGMPPVLNDLANGPPGVEEYLRSARVVITGGGPTPQVVWEKWVKRFGIPVVNAYGLSETIVVGSATSTVPGWEYYSRGYASVGAPVAYTEVKIVDINDPSKELKPGEVGEIALRGPAVAKGYWRNEKATKESFLPDGWFLTGDMGYVDDDGVLYVTDRKKDIIITSGFNVSPAEVENILLQNPKIKEVAVFSIKDERRGEVPAAAVVLKEGVDASEDEIIEWARRHMAGYKVPRKIIFLDEIPKMSGWKVLRRVLREKYGGG